MSRVLFGTAALLAIGFLFAACGSDSGDRRTIAITQTDDGCTPASIDLKAGEKVTFAVKNDGKKDREVEGIDGTKLEEVLVPSGRTRNVPYTAPGSEGVQKVKCYVPGGNSAIIELKVSGSSAKAGDDEGDGAESKYATTKAPNTTVDTELVSYKIKPDVASVPKGPTKFVARNTADEVHELAVLRVKDDGTYESAGEAEDLDPGTSKELVLDLPPGKYLLACLIIPGEAGSTVDHFQEGMHTDFEVTG